MVGAQLEAPVTATDAAARAAATGLEAHRLAHRALPGRDLAEVELSTALLGAELAAPLVVDVPAGAVAAPFARAATEQGLALVVEEDGARLHDRPPLLLVRLPGRALLEGPEPAERLVALTSADGVVVELDPVGEALASAAASRGASTSRRRAARSRRSRSSCARRAPGSTAPTPGRSRRSGRRPSTSAAPARARPPTRRSRAGA